MDRKEIRSIAQRILDDGPDPAVRVRLLRDVLKVGPENRELVSSIEELYNSRSIRLMAEEQSSDGGWGRFHSRDYRSHNKIITTEFAINRSLSLGLSSESLILQRAVEYLRRMVNHEIEFPDPAEKNDRWPTGINLFTASTLARIDPADPSLDQSKGVWSAIARRTFDGSCSSEAEAKAHTELTGAAVDDSYLQMRNNYTLVLLGTCSGRLNARTYTLLLDWLIGLPDGIGYFGVSLLPNHTLHKAGFLDRWFSLWEILAEMPGSKKYSYL